MNTKLVDVRGIIMRLPENPPSDKEVNEIMASKYDMKRIGELKPYLDIINAQYLHWDELPMRFRKIDLKFLWSYVSLTRQFTARYIKINGISLRYVQTPQIEKTLHNLDIQIGDKIEVEMQLPSQGLKRKYLRNSLMEEAIASSQLEGAATSRRVAKRMLRENRKPRNHSEQMIVNNYLGMRYIKEHTKPNDALTPELIKDIHKIISKDTLQKKQYEGTFRTDNNVKVWIHGEVVYQPPDYTLINKLVDEVCTFANTESTEYYLNPIVKAIMIHYMIGYIHPFNDGNGRTARALFYWYLLSQRYDYLEYIAVSTAIKNAPMKYARAYLYCENDHNDVTYFVKFNLRQLEIAVNSFKEYINKTIGENRKIIETIRENPNLDLRQVDIIINMSKNERQITIEEMQEIYDITYQTARASLLDLVKQGYMHKFTIGKQFFFTLDKEKCMSAFNKTEE